MTRRAPQAARLPERGPESSWRRPLDPAHYDRGPLLRADEAAALHEARSSLDRWRDPDWLWAVALGRIVRPLTDAAAAIELPSARGRRPRDDAVALVLGACADEGRSVWGLAPATWVRLVGADQRAFFAAHPAAPDPAVRSYVMALGYLLGCFSDLARYGRYERERLARKVFGRARVDGAVAAIRDVLSGWGYQGVRHTGLASALCEALLAAGSPRLADLSTELLEELRAAPHVGVSRRSELHQVQRALAALGIAAAPATWGAAQTVALEGKAWGDPTTYNAAGQTIGWTHADNLRFRFLYVGRYGVAWDDVGLGLGLHHMGARQYSPSLGRFVQPDPSTLEENLYGYADNSPVTKTDPAGLFFQAEDGAGGGAFRAGGRAGGSGGGGGGAGAYLNGIIKWRTGAKIRNAVPIARWKTRASARADLSGVTDGVVGAANRFLRQNAPANSTSIRIVQVASNRFEISAFSPARNPGYGKVYKWVVNGRGVILLKIKYSWNMNVLRASKIELIGRGK
jgi:RHS repeat-associated protein